MNPRRLALDARMVRHTGIGTYLRGILGSLRRNGKLKKIDIALHGPAEALEAFREAEILDFRAPIYSLKEQAEYPRRLAGCRLWHAPHYNVPLWKGETRLVVTVHDLIHWIFRKDYFSPLQAAYAGMMMSRAVNGSDHIIAVSENTKEDLIRHFKAPAKKITVIHEAVDPDFCVPGDPAGTLKIRQGLHVPPEYFLYVGSLKPHKNVLWLIRLFRKLHQEKKLKSPLVIVGRKDKKYPPEFRELQDLVSDPVVLHLTGVGDEALPALYAGALALVHPSRYEGFGLTLLEAMACGTPVLAVRTSSIPEVVGEAACLVDSFQDHDMMQALCRMEQEPAMRNELTLKGRQRLENFSWDQAAAKTLEVYERVLSKP
ncbi:MAG TPA: glycosyltransferase family 1 protein [Verrucomicrobiae bacterium]|jgi:glycosyltransferase involved in cell wall biosynthesis|nr:glycosyltransferase family 1 protein [Verrucomicrobiae bacterium]